MKQLSRQGLSTNCDHFGFFGSPFVRESSLILLVNQRVFAFFTLGRRVSSSANYDVTRHFQKAFSRPLSPPNIWMPRIVLGPPSIFPFNLPAKINVI